ncbi:hypothetical protein HUU05_04485 [candidate division KSB1 bacterium]|nr:hypothetical protein [candidate division KSB1 bacterium]
MNLKSLLINFLFTFVIAFIVAAIATLLWNLYQNGSATVDWATSLRTALILGVAFPLVDALRNKSRPKNVH